MNLTISSIGVNCKATYPNLKPSAKRNNPSFNGGTNSKAIISFGMAIAAAGLLSLSYCIKKQADNDTTNAGSYIINNNNSLNSDSENNSVKHIYHYFPRENSDIQSVPYDWLETIYPNGKIEKDSFEYKIVIEPNGEQTVTKTNFDKFGNRTVTTTYPDGSKIECTYYKTKFIDETKYEKKSYWSNKNIKSVIFINEYHTDSLNIASPKISEHSLDLYNENGILIKWETNIKNPERNEKNNKYDRLKRLIYDDINNETHYYKGKSKTPYRSISEKDGCKRIKLYSSDGPVKRIYFKAADGTITEQ